jgi:hypothetical protein
MENPKAGYDIRRMEGHRRICHSPCRMFPIRRLAVALFAFGEGLPVLELIGKVQAALPIESEREAFQDVSSSNHKPSHNNPNQNRSIVHSKSKVTMLYDYQPT